MKKNVLYELPHYYGFLIIDFYSLSVMIQLSCFILNKKRQAETCTYFIWTNVSVLVCNLTMQSPCAVCMLRYILISNRLCSFKCGRKYPWLAFEKKKSLWSVENTNLIVPLNDFQTIFLNFTKKCTMAKMTSIKGSF